MKELRDLAKAANISNQKLTFITYTDINDRTKIGFDNVIGAMGTDIHTINDNE